MKNFYKLSMLLGIVLVFITGCGANDESTGENENNDFPRGISVGSATIGGTFHVYATGWSDMITDVLG